MKNKHILALCAGLFAGEAFIMPLIDSDLRFNDAVALGVIYAVIAFVIIVSLRFIVKSFTET
jgi:hypothetical protein